MDTAVSNSNEPKYRDWIAVYRAMRSHPVIGFLKPDGQTIRKGVVVCESMAWIDLCMEAKWKDVKQDNNGKLIIVERGQLQGARNWLAARWGWSQDKVRWFLKKLQDNGMITVSAPKITQAVLANHTQSRTQKRAHYNNVITICNYDIYQAAVELDAQLQSQSNTQSTPNQHPQHNKETNKQTQTEAPAGGQSDVSWPNGDFVHANGEAIHVSLLGRRLKFEYASIDLWAAVNLCPPDRAREIVEAEARGWVADQKWPDTPSRWLQKQLANWRVYKTIAETKIKNEQARGQRDQRFGRARTINDMTPEEYQAYLDRGCA